MLKSVATTPEHTFHQPQLVDSTIEADTDYSMDSIPIPEFDIALAARIELALQPPTDVPEWVSYDNCKHKGCVQLYLDSWEAPCQDEAEDPSGWTYREPTSPSEVARFLWFIATRPVVAEVEVYEWNADYTQCDTEYRTMSLDGLREEMAMSHYLQTVRSRGVYPSWEYQEEHAFSIQHMAQFLLDYIADKYSSYGAAIRDFISNAHAIEHHSGYEVVAYGKGIELQLAYEEFVEGLLEQAIEPIPHVEYDAIIELVNRVATGEGLNDSAYDFDDDENGASLVKAPLIRQQGTHKVPTFLKTKLFLDFSRDDDLEFNFDELIRTLHNSPLYEKPPVGNNPFAHPENIRPEKTGDSIKELMKAVVELYENDEDYEGVIEYQIIKDSMNISRVMFDLLLLEAKEKELIEWDGSTEVELADKGRFYAVEHKLIKA